MMTEEERERLTRIADSLDGTRPMALNARDARWLTELARRMDKEESER